MNLHPYWRNCPSPQIHKFLHWKQNNIFCHKLAHPIKIYVLKTEAPMGKFAGLHGTLPLCDYLGLLQFDELLTHWSLMMIHVIKLGHHCLMAPSHYLLQLGLNVNVILWHSPENNFTANARDISNYYCQTSNISHTTSPNLNVVVSSCSCHWPIHRSQVISWKWRCSWSSAYRQCSNCILVSNNFIA